MKKTTILLLIIGLTLTTASNAETFSMQGYVKKTPEKKEIKTTKISTITNYHNKFQPQNLTELKIREQERKTQYQQELQNVEKQFRKTLKNQNKAKNAVDTLNDMQKILLGLGPYISRISQEFDYSLNKTLIYEAEILNQNKIYTFLMGGNEKAAENLLYEVKANKKNIKMLKEAVNQIPEDPEIQKEYTKQIQDLEDEQKRLEKLAKKEKRKKGVIGIFFD